MGEWVAPVLGEVDSQWIDILVEAQRAHGPQQVVPVDLKSRDRAGYPVSNSEVLGLTVFRFSCWHLSLASLVMKLMYSDTHSWMVSLASLAICNARKERDMEGEGQDMSRERRAVTFAFPGSTVFMMRAMLATGK